MKNTIHINFAIFLIIANIIYSSASASTDISTVASPLFEGTEGCFLLYDASTNAEIAQFNKAKCATQMAPDSTFKIALSLMAFDAEIIDQKTIFKWDKTPKGMEIWNSNHTPKTWMQFSVVWVSQEITQKIGLIKIKNYLKDFDYGNQDFSGDKERNNGLTEAWLESSLKISPEEQIQFLRKIINHNLPVKNSAIENTIENMYLQDLDNSTKLYGKTGAGFTANRTLQNGWFEGFIISKSGHKYVFVSALTGNLGSNLTSSIKAKKNAITILNTLNL
ncbi:OXA-1 family class D beta-lactamase [Shigella flexneri]